MPVFFDLKSRVDDQSPGDARLYDLLLDGESIAVSVPFDVAFDVIRAEIRDPDVFRETCDGITVARLTGKEFRASSELLRRRYIPSLSE